MITALKRIALVLLFGLFALIGKTQVIVNPSTNALALAQKLVGEGISISNVTISGANGTNIPSGFFYNQGGTQLNLDSGIVLTSGRAQTSGTATGINAPASSSASNTNGTPGDAQLDALAQ